jgi:hypothetical protein
LHGAELAAAVGHLCLAAVRADVQAEAGIGLRFAMAAVGVLAAATSPWRLAAAALELSRCAVLLEVLERAAVERQTCAELGVGL